jgi:parvulin-like peptidyl-prolyl isomerase
VEASFRAQYRRVLDDLGRLGLSEAFYRGLFEAQLLREKLRQAVVQVPGAEPQLHLRHILLQTREEAEAALTRLQGGEDFALLAQELSQDPGSSPLGGDLGWAPRGIYDPTFEDAAWALAAGELSPIVETGFGFHIIQWVERDEARPLDPTLLEQRREEAFRTWVDERKAAARIERTLTSGGPTPTPPLATLTPTAGNGA